MKKNTNNFILTHLGMTCAEYQRLPEIKKICVEHFEENCVKCKISEI